MEANKGSIKNSDSKREEELIKHIEQLEGRLAAYTDISNGKDAALIRLEKENERLKEENERLKAEVEALRNRKVVRLVDKIAPGKGR